MKNTTPRRRPSWSYFRSKVRKRHRRTFPTWLSQVKARPFARTVTTIPRRKESSSSYAKPTATDTPPRFTSTSPKITTATLTVRTRLARKLSRMIDIRPILTSPRNDISRPSTCPLRGSLGPTAATTSTCPSRANLTFAPARMTLVRGTWNASRR